MFKEIFIWIVILLIIVFYYDWKAEAGYNKYLEEKIRRNRGQKQQRRLLKKTKLNYYCKIIEGYCADTYKDGYHDVTRWPLTQKLLDEYHMACLCKECAPHRSEHSG